MELRCAGTICLNFNEYFGIHVIASPPNFLKFTIGSKIDQIVRKTEFVIIIIGLKYINRHPNSGFAQKR